LITYVKQDLFESPAQVIVNTVNTVGVMGKGIAKRFKDIYPDMFVKYVELCEKDLFNVGQLWLYKTPHKWVLNFPTKKHWRSSSKIEYVEEGLKKFVETYEEKGITSISFPLLGCGNGGLNWENEVKPLMEKYLRPLPIEVYIHLSDNQKKPEHKNIKDTKKWLQSMPNILSFNEVWDDLVNYTQFFGEVIYNGQKWSLDVLNLEREDHGINEDEAEISEDITQAPTITFKNESEQFFATKAQLSGFWRYLRKNGFVKLLDVPEGLSEMGGLIFSLFNNLDYIETVELAHKYSKESDFSTGIRVIPHKSNMSDSNKGEVLDEVKE